MQEIIDKINYYAQAFRQVKPGLYKTYSEMKQKEEYVRSKSLILRFLCTTIPFLVPILFVICADSSEFRLLYPVLPIYMLYAFLWMAILFLFASMKEMNVCLLGIIATFIDMIVVFLCSTRLFTSTKSHIIIFVILFFLPLGIGVITEMLNKDLISVYWGNIEKKQGYNDELKNLYNVAQEIPKSFYTQGINGKSTLANYHNLELLDKYVIGNKIPPVLFPHFDAGSLDKKYQEFLHSASVKAIIEKYNEPQLMQLLMKQEDAFLIQNAVKEKYLKVVDELETEFPKFLFYPPKVCMMRNALQFCNPQNTGESLGANTPNFTSAFVAMTDQQEFSEIYYMFDDYYGEIWDEFEKDQKITMAGEKGERDTLKEFDFYKNQWRILTNIRLEVNDQSVESDIIAVTPHGIFVIEVKNLGASGAYGLRIESDGRWSKIKNGKITEIKDSVTKQNVRHLHGVEMVVNNALGNTYDNWITAHSIIVLANDKVDIEDATNSVKRKSEMVNTIRQYPIVFNEEKMDAIASVLQNNTKEPKGYEMKNWGKYILRTCLELCEREKLIYPQLEPMLNLAIAMNNVSEGSLNNTDFV